MEEDHWKNQEMIESEWSKIKNEGYSLLEKFGLKEKCEDVFTNKFRQDFFGGLYYIEFISDFIDKCPIPYTTVIKELLAKIVVLLRYYKESNIIIASNEEFNIMTLVLFHNLCSLIGYKNVPLWDIKIHNPYTEEYLKGVRNEK